MYWSIALVIFQLFSCCIFTPDSSCTYSRCQQLPSQQAGSLSVVEWRHTWTLMTSVESQLERTDSAAASGVTSRLCTWQCHRHRQTRWNNVECLLITFNRAMHYSAKRGLAIACSQSIRPYVCPSVHDVGELWSHMLEIFEINCPRN